MANISWSHYLCRNALGSLCTCLHSHGTVHSWRLRVNEPLATNLSWTTKLWGATTHSYFEEYVCAWVCGGIEKRLTQYRRTVGNRPGTTDTEVPRVLGNTVSRSEINENILFKSRAVDFHICYGLFVCPRTRMAVKVSEHCLSHKTKTKTGGFMEVEVKGKVKKKYIHRELQRIHLTYNESKKKRRKLALN